MSINQPQNRIKPKLLREQKTEALLVFIRTTLEQTFNEIDKKGSYTEIGSKEDTKYIYDILESLNNNLKECVVNSSYLQSIIANSDKSLFFKSLAKKEEPLMTYYDAIVKSISSNLSSGTLWIPELMIIALLSQWILEEEKSVYLYPFLKDIDYLQVMERFDKARLEENQDKKDIVFNMYKLSTKLIDSLKSSAYKTNIHRKSKSRKR
ncbi:MAG: hypothetical protein U9R16_07060 [Campylobacterota bacterium]|nr:hypothetical protein [Campylobacterota bacterium]